MKTATQIVRELGGEVRETEEENLEALQAEILILRQAKRDADDEATRAERRLGHEIAARANAESRAKAAEGVVAATEAAIANAHREAMRDGAPLKTHQRGGDDEQRREFASGIGPVGEGAEYPRVAAG